MGNWRAIVRCRPLGPADSQSPRGLPVRVDALREPAAGSNTSCRRDDCITTLLVLMFLLVRSVSCTGSWLAIATCADDDPTGET
jgi:hypothetical protein